MNYVYNCFVLCVNLVFLSVHVGAGGYTPTETVMVSDAAFGDDIIVRLYGTYLASPLD